MKLGQPVTFTDFFGMLIGQTLLGPEVITITMITPFVEFKFGFSFAWK